MLNIKNAIGIIDRRIKRWAKGEIDKRLGQYRLVELGLLLVGIGYGIAFWYNMDMSELNNISEKHSQIRREFQRREDLTLNMTNIVNNYAQHERVLFQHVSDMRALMQSLGSLKGAPPAAKRGEIMQALYGLTALAEQYPDLKAEERFRDLMYMAEITENRIADVMNEYIEKVHEFNVCNQCFWCNYFTYPLAIFIPLPAFWEYFHAVQQFDPVVAADNLMGEFGGSEGPAAPIAGPFVAPSDLEPPT